MSASTQSFAPRHWGKLCSLGSHKSLMPLFGPSVTGWHLSVVARATAVQGALGHAPQCASPILLLLHLRHPGLRRVEGALVGLDGDERCAQVLDQRVEDPICSFACTKTQKQEMISSTCKNKIWFC